MAIIQPEVISTSPRSTPFGRLLKILLVICQVFGVAALIESRGISRCLHHIWSLLILIYIYTVNYLQAILIEPIFTTIEKALYLSEFLTNCIIVTLLIGSCYHYKAYYQSVPIKLEEFNARVKLHYGEKCAKDTLHFKLHKELLCLVVLVVAFLSICFFIDLMYFNFDIMQSIRSSGAYNVPNVLISLNLAQYWLAMRYICLLYRRLNDILKNLTNTAVKNCSGATKINFDELQQFEKLVPLKTEMLWFKREFSTNPYKSLSDNDILEYTRSVYSDLDTLMSELVNVFGYILLLNFLGSFLDLSVEYFAVYKFFDRPSVNELVAFSYKVLWLVLHTGRIFFLLLTNNAIIREKCRTSFVLNELQPSSKDMEHSINRFHLQLMVRKQSESACGIVDLDLLFLGGITSALATWVIFLIQIDLGNESLNDSAAHNKTNHTAILSV